MKSITHMFVCIGLCIAPLSGFATEHNAFHVFCQDDLWGFGDTSDLGYATIYKPDLNLANNGSYPDPRRPTADNVLINNELDEFYLRISFNPGTTPSIDLLSDISYGNELYFPPGQYAMKHIVSGQNLYVWYGFQDGHTPPVITTDAEWTFKVIGSDPVASVDFFVSYHGRTSGAMPDLDPNYQNLRVLSPDHLSLIQGETPQASMSSGNSFSSIPSGQKLIVLIHGWNSDNSHNPYGDIATWQTLEKNLLLSSVVKAQGWVVTRYDWARDAMTGPADPLPLDHPAVIDNSNASRDAASAHGLKLGKTVGAKLPAQILFIAHSAGNWAAKRAAAYLKWKNPGVKIQITSLDPFVNDDDGSSPGDDLDLTRSFEMMSQWTDYRENYYVIDKLLGGNQSDLFTGWSSGDFVGWHNEQLFSGVPLYEDYMLSHSGPVSWFGKTVAALNSKQLRNLDVGFIYDLPARSASPNDDFPGEQLSGLTGDRTWFNYRATSQSSGPNHDVWGSWTAPASGQTTFSVTGSDMQNIDGTAYVLPVVTIYTGSSVGSLTKVADGGVPFSAVAGTTYRISVDGPSEGLSGNAIGKIPLHWSMIGTPAATVAIMAPASGSTVANTATVTANASGATKTEFYLDGVLQSTDYAVPFNWSWNTLTSANGNHALVAKAYNGSQLIGSSPTVLVTVNNNVVDPPPPASDIYEPNNSSATAYGPIVSGTPLIARIDSPTDADWFKATVNAAGVIHLALNVPSNNDYDLELFGPAGTWLAGSYNKSGINESLDYAVSEVGIYTFRIYGYPVGSGSYNSITPYTLEYSLSSGASATYAMTVNSIHGLVTRSPAMDAYPSGTTVSLMANPSPGYQFTGWSGDLSGTNSPLTVFMDGNKILTAGFSISTAAQGSITVNIQPPEAVIAGAQWKLTTENEWHNSGTSISGLANGSYTAQYSVPPGWYHAADQSINLSELNPNASIVEIYSQQWSDPINTWLWRNPIPLGNELLSVAHGNGQFVAVGGAGIATSSDGITWINRSSGQMNDSFVAVTYGGGQFVAVGGNSSLGTILTSPDGIIWTHRNSGMNYNLTGVTYGNGQFVAVANGSMFLTSSDGISWTKRYSGTSTYAFFGVAFGNGQFVAVGSDASGTSLGAILTSPDGITWTSRISNLKYLLKAVVYGNGQFVAVGYNGDGTASGVILTSSDGVTWTNRLLDTTPQWLAGVCYGNGRYLVVGNKSSLGVILTSVDGITWTSHGSGGIGSLNSVVSRDGQFVAVGGGGITTSSDGIAWTNRTSGTSRKLLQCVAYGNGQFVAVGEAGTILTSPDGITWTSRSSGTTYGLSGVTYGNGKFVVVGSDGSGYLGKILTSQDGIIWTSRSSSSTYWLSSVTYGNGQFVAVGAGSLGMLLTSPDGITWTHRNSGTAGYLEDVVYGNGQFVAVDYFGVVLTSPDGITWATHSTGQLGGGLSSVTYGNGLFVAVGANSVGILTSSDGISWTRVSSQGLYTVTYGNGQFVAVAYGAIQMSSDGITWTSRSSGTSSHQLLLGATYGNGQFVVVGGSGTILQSGNLTQSQLGYAPKILDQPNDQSVAKTGSFTVSVFAEGTQPLRYQWLANGITIIGQVSNNLDLNNVGIGQVGNYSVIVSNDYGAVTSDVAVLTILLPPNIIIQPQNRNVLLNGTGTFSIVVNGEPPFSYKWRHNGLDLPGTDSDTFKLSGIQSSDTGTYSVVVTSSGGSVTSASATLNIVAPVKLTTISEYGGTAPFSIGTNIYARGTVLTSSVTNSPINNGATQYICTGWIGSGSVPASGNTNYTGPFSITNDSAITWLWRTNILFKATINSPFAVGSVGVCRNFKMKIGFPGYNRAEILTNFPALLVLSTNVSGFQYNQFRSPGGLDLRIWDESESQQLNYEIEQWNTNGNSYVWVQLPVLTATNTWIWAFWGDSGDLAQLSGTTNGAVWSNGYTVVWHLSNGGIGLRRDSTANHKDAAPQNYIGTESSTGFVGLADSLNGRTNYLTTTYTQVNVTAYSIEAWVKTTDTNIQKAILQNRGSGSGKSLTLGFGAPVGGASGKPFFGVDSDGIILGKQATNTYNDGQWHHLVGTWSATAGTAITTSQFRIYVDGSNRSDSNMAGGSATSPPSAPLSGLGGAKIGRHDVWNKYLNAMVDEVRISTVVRSSNWVWSCWLNAASNSVFNSYGTVEAVLSTPTTNSFYLPGTWLVVFITNSIIVNGTTQYVYSGWTGSGSAPVSGLTTNTEPFSLKNDTSIVWNWRTNFWLHVDKTGNGTVSTNDAWFAFGTNILIAASPAIYFASGGWQGQTNECTMTSNTISVLINSARTITAIFNEDVTTNNIPKWWLASYGLTNFNADATQDIDQDGPLTWEEYVAGTDPTNPASVFRFVAAGRTNSNAFVLRWPSVSNRFYALRRSTNLYLGTNGFLFVPGASNLPGTPAENVFTDSIPASGGVFYRIDVNK